MRYRRLSPSQGHEGSSFELELEVYGFQIAGLLLQIGSREWYTAAARVGDD